MKIRFAKGLIDNLEVSDNYGKNNIYKICSFTCDNCGYEVESEYKSLEKHRFCKFSNLNGNDKINADRLILSMIPKYKIKQERQIWALSHFDKLIVRIQRLYLRITGCKEIFLPIPKTNENIPDSFIDYYCPKCHLPIRIYYFSYMGGRHCERGFEIKYILN